MPQYSQIDPIEIRMKNALTQGRSETRSNGTCFGLREHWAVRDSDLWKEKIPIKIHLSVLDRSRLSQLRIRKGVPDSAKVEIDREPNGDFTVRVSWLTSDRATQPLWLRLPAKH